MLLLLVAHIILAFLSIVWSGYVLIAPSTQKLNFSYLLVGGALASGTGLVLATHSRLLPSCLSG